MSESYLPFFRKYRPQSLCELVGQESLVKALSNAIELDRIANAYLFCGPRGTGKTSSARILAKSLNCTSGPTLNPCQKCASCLDITNTSGLDVIEIDAATNRGISDAKELIAQAQYAPMGGKYKIFIIDEVHMLSTEAFNALLKTFEEPPKNVIFILATTEPHKVIETIVSRCQRFDFRRIVTEDIVKKLRDIATLEKIKITDDALFTIAKNVSGGMRDSLALLDQVSILGVKEEITKETIEELLGKITFDTLLDLAKKLTAQDLEGSMAAIEGIYSNGNEPRNLCENFMEFLRNIIMVINAKNPSEVLKFTTLNAQDTDNVLASFKKEQLNSLIAMLNRVVEFYKEIKDATNPYLWVELMAIELASGVKTPVAAAQTTVQSAKTPAPKTEIKVEPRPEPVAAGKIAKLENIETGPEPVAKKAAEAEVKLEAPSVEPALEPALEPSKENENISDTRAQIAEKADKSSTNTINVQDAWSRIVNSIESIPAKFFFSGVARLVGLNEDEIVIGFAHQNSLLQAKSDSKLTPLEHALDNVFDKRPNVKMMLISKDTPAVEAQVKQAKKPEVPPKEEIQPLEDYVEEGTVTAPEPNEPKPVLSKSAPSEPASYEKEPQEATRAIYSAKTREMIENYNGKIIY